MRRSWGLGISLVAAMAVSLSTSPSRSSAAASEPVFTNKPRFRIPFRFDTAEMQRLRPREIQLFVSQDRGASWRHMQSANPNAGRFDFEATHDDEYWFAVKTVDAQNQLFPRENAEPGLKVIVDTAPPRIEVTLREIARGKVQLSWIADDPHLDPTTLRLEYMQSGAAGWQQVSVVPQASGQTTWSVQPGGFVAVRGMITDLAGNVGQTESQLSVGANGGTKPESDEVEYREPVANGESPRDPFTPQARLAPAVSGNDRPANQSPEMPALPNSSLPNQAAASRATLPSATTGNAAGATTLGKLISNSPANGGEVGEQPPFGSHGSAGDSITKPALKQVVNSRSFQIGYRIDGAGPAGISAVELYVTQDSGQSWLLYGEDADRQSPFIVRVPTDGEYGFEFRVRNANGPSSEPPKPGERPSILVTVDQTPPVAQLFPVQIGQGESANQLLIQWNVRDEHLGAAPVALSCAPGPGGPWRAIGDWQANSGRYVWSPEPGMPERVYLRLTVRDEAGNRTEVASPEAITVKNPRAATRMMGIQAPDPASMPR